MKKLREFNYHKEQLTKLIDGNYQKSIKVFDGEGNSTKQMDLNSDSIPILIEFLTKELKKLKE